METIVAADSRLATWVEDALRHQGGSASIVDVAKRIWLNHEQELRASGDLFFTWQYDMRWAAKELRDQNVIKPATSSPRGIWELVR
jgi:hypothetical protein